MHNRSDDKQRLSDRGRKAAYARWDACHASIPCPDYGGLPDPCYTITVKRHGNDKEDIYVFHPAHKSGSFKVDINGVYWQTCGFTAALVEIRKRCKRQPVINL